MKYQKRAHTRLHHTETHPHDDGTIRVEAHLMHNPPDVRYSDIPSSDRDHNEKGESKKDPRHYAYAVGTHDYPNMVHKATAYDHEEAGDMVRDIHNAHRYDPGRRRPKSPELEHGDHQVTAEEEYSEFSE